MYSLMLSSIAPIARYAKAVPVKILSAALALTFASGCSLLSDQLDSAAKGAGKVVKTYCENITIPEIREEVRAAVNKHASPHSVAITCEDGRGPTLQSDEPASVITDESTDSGQ